MFFYNFMEQISKFICFCLFYHLPKLEASFLHELVPVAIHFFISKLILRLILRVLY